ncbi:MAG: DUF2802 domain-containing protein [Methylomonas sp.]|nr:DUF2802 domain-containing protein [Methylomonas sp.]
MDESYYLVIVVGETVLLGLISFFLARLWRAQKKLEQDLKVLSAQLESGNGDVTGLCSAAVAVDNRLAVYESRLNDLIDNIADTQAHSFGAEEAHEEPVATQGYQHAIEKIRRGADIEELVRSCSLTRDEAMLLMRLHGKR